MGRICIKKPDRPVRLPRRSNVSSMVVGRSREPLHGAPDAYLNLFVEIAVRVKVKLKAEIEQSGGVGA